MVNKVDSGGCLQNSRMEIKSGKQIAFRTSLSLRNFKARISYPEGGSFSSRQMFPRRSRKFVFYHRKLCITNFTFEDPRRRDVMKNHFFHFIFIPGQISACPYLSHCFHALPFSFIQYNSRIRFR